MIPRHPSVFFTSDLHAYGIGNTGWFDDNSPRALAGRCLLDAIEHLRTMPKFAARDWHRVNANVARVVHRCLTDPALPRRDVLDRIAAGFEDTCAQLLASRQYRIPFYGDDFRDWAEVVDAFCELQPISASAAEAAQRELDQFRRTVQIRAPSGLTINDPEREWYGPATAAIVHRVLERRATPMDPDLRDTLQAHALHKIEHDRYRGRDIPPWQVSWHYGQVVSVFSRAATDQAVRLADFSWLSAPLSSSQRVTVLACILQGACELKDRRTITRALDELYPRQVPTRPLGQGLFGDSADMSVAVLDALWPGLEEREKASLGAMLDALLFLYTKANTIGFVVTTAPDIDRLIAAMGDGARVEQRNATRAVVRHPSFQAVICQGQSLAETAAATVKTIKEHGARWIIMPGRGEALGPADPPTGSGVQFGRPGGGDLVISTSLAPFGNRDEVRSVMNVSDPPLPGDDWIMIPTSAELSRLAHKAAADFSDGLAVFFEGLTVSRSGLLTTLDKQDIRAAFPGALAADENGYMMGLICLSHGVPCLNLRSLAHETDAPQWAAAPTIEAAFQIAVRVAELLSRQW